MFSGVSCKEGGRLLSSKAVCRSSSRQCASGGMFSAQITRKENWLGALQCGSWLLYLEQR